MTRVFAGIATSLDGYVAGPNPSLDEPLGEGGESLHDWVFGLEAWRRPHGLEGGTTTPSSAVIEERIARTGAVVMGRRMYSSGEGPWEEDPKADGWWGHEPPFHVPVFVVTHHARAPLPKEGGTTFTFVTDGVESALVQAREAVGDRDVSIAGGASVIQQVLAAVSSTSSRSILRPSSSAVARGSSAPVPPARSSSTGSWTRRASPTCTTAWCADTARRTKGAA